VFDARALVGARRVRLVRWRERTLQRPAHDTRTAAILGIALGACFTICFVTGLVSHTMQHPPSWLDWPPRPAGLYRFTQGLHVISGTAAIPLILAKLWSVYPRFFLPAPTRVAQIVERVSLVPLVGGSLFMLFTGTANIARWYPWPFFFPRAHYWGAWITIGALVVHVGARASATRASLRRDPTGEQRDHREDRARAAESGERARAAESGERARAAESGEELPGEVGRRAVLGWSAAASVGLCAVTAGQTVPLLRRVVLFAPRRPDIGSQGLPVNRAAAEAGVIERARDRNWRLIVEVGGREAASYDLAALSSLPQRSAVLPIACVEGWSAEARWTGVSVRDVLGRSDVSDFGSIEVVSLEQDGLYRTSNLNVSQARDRDTLLATGVNGETLDLDHGYPLRLVGPNRPGVMQTKWVSRLVVR
jgi:DMSO/TMAO reductase YedYZ molybdopterin-dependent catalytic subunit